MKTLAVITARKGSKRFPGKNIYPLKGKPLLSYTIEAAVKCSLVDRVVLTTDCSEIAEVGKQYGAEVPFLRPEELARDETLSPVTVEHAVSYLEKSEGYFADLILLLQPTSPLRNCDHVSQAIKHFLTIPDLDSLVSIQENDYPPHLLYKIEGNYLTPFSERGEQYYHLRRQDLLKTYQHNGAIWICKRSLLKQKNSMLGDRLGYFLMDQLSSMHIDTKWDFQLIDAVLSNLEKQ